MRDIGQLTEDSEATEARRKRRSAAADFFWGGGLAIAAITTLVAAGSWYYGSFGGLRAKLRGEAIYQLPSRVQHVADSTPAQSILTYRIVNLTGQPMGLLGASRSCDCVAIEGLPATVAPRKIHAIEARYASDAAEYARQLTLLTDHGSFVLASDSDLQNP